MRTPLWLLSLLSCAAAAPTLAQTTARLAPDAFTVRAGEPCRVRWSSIARPRTPEPLPEAAGTRWSSEELDWFFVKDGGRQENFGAERFSESLFGAEGAARVTLSGPGVAVLGIDRVARAETVEPESLADFAAAFGLRLPGAPTRALPVRRVESAKLLVRVVDTGGRVRPSPAATDKTGQRAEIRPLLDPTRGPFGGDLPFRVYLPGGSSGITVRATHVPTGETETCRTDDGGLGHFRLRAAGEWFVEAHRVDEIVSADASGPVDRTVPQPELEIQSATLSFLVPGANTEGAPASDKATRSHGGEE